VKNIMRLQFFICLVITIGFGTSCERESDDVNEINDHFYLRIDGANLPVQVEGNLASGVMVVVLHGGPGGDAVTYNEGIKGFSDQMEKEFAMVYYDQRGSGSSSGRYTKREFLTVDQHVTDLKLLISTLKERFGSENKIVLLGHSWGGTLGTAYLLAPGLEETVDGWIEVDGAHNFDGTPEVKEYFREVGNEMIRNGFSSSFWNEVIAFTEEMDDENGNDISKLNAYGYEAESTLGSDGFLSGQSTAADFRRMKYFSKYNPQAVKSNLFFTSSGFGMFDEVTEVDFTDRLNEITLPTLLLWGRYDFVVPLTLGEQALENLGTPDHQKSLIIFESSGHSPMVNQSQVFSEQVIDWIKQLN